jgi:LPXTG-motif cell wall-anchored protein
LQRFTPSARRLLTFSGAAFTGIVASAMLAAPAMATHATVSGDSACEKNGTYTITWKVTSDYPDVELTITDVKVTPDTPLTPALEGKKIKGEPGSVTVTQTVPGDTTKAELSFHPVWGNKHKVDRYSGTVRLKGKCKPEPTPSESSEAPPPGGGGGGGGAPSTPPTPSKPTLPVTGSQTAIYGGGAAVLLGAGAGLFFVARRRRIRFEA